MISEFTVVEARYYKKRYRFTVPSKIMGEERREKDNSHLGHYTFVKLTAPDGKTEIAPTWEYLFRNLAVKAMFHFHQFEGKHTRIDNSFMEYCDKHGIKAEYLGEEPEPYKAIALEEKHRYHHGRLHPLEERYREEVKEQKEWEEARKRKLDLAHMILEVNRMRAEKGYGPISADDFITAEHHLRELRELDDQTAALAYAAGTETGRMTCSKPVPTHSLRPTVRPLVEEQLLDVMLDATGKIILTGDSVVFIDPAGCFGLRKVKSIVPSSAIGGKHTAQVGDLTGGWAGNRLFRVPREQDNSIGSLTWASKDHKNYTVRVGSTVYDPDNNRVRVYGIKGGLNGDEGKGPKKVPLILCVKRLSCGEVVTYVFRREHVTPSDIRDLEICDAADRKMHMAEAVAAAKRLGEKLADPGPDSTIDYFGDRLVAGDAYINTEEGHRHGVFIVDRIVRKHDKVQIVSDNLPYTNEPQKVCKVSEDSNPDPDKRRRHLVMEIQGRKTTICIGTNIVFMWEGHHTRGRVSGIDTARGTRLKVVASFGSKDKRVCEKYWIGEYEIYKVCG